MENKSTDSANSVSTVNNIVQDIKNKDLKVASKFGSSFDNQVNEIKDAKLKESENRKKDTFLV